MQSAHPFRPADIAVVETPFANALHSYQGLCPWSPDGEALLYLGFQESDTAASVTIRHLSSHRETALARTSSFNYHTAAFQQWALDGTAVIFENCGSQGLECVIVPVDGTPPACHPGLHVRAVSADTQRGYGTMADALGPDAAAARIEFSTGRVSELFTAREAGAHLPADIAADCEFRINHFVPNADESLAFFKLCKPAPHRKIPGQMDDWGAFFVQDLHSGVMRCLGQRISGHPQWMPDGRRIVNIMQPQDGSDNRWIVTQDAVTGEVKRLVDFPIEGPGHPVVSPCGEFLATDAYTASRQSCPVYLIKLRTGQMAEIARFAHSTRVTDTYQPHTIFRSNLHPVWSPNGTALLVNTNDGGPRVTMKMLRNFLS